MDDHEERTGLRHKMTDQFNDQRHKSDLADIIAAYQAEPTPTTGKAALPDGNKNSGLSCDIDSYIADFDDYDLTDDQKREVIASLWHFMVSIAALQFGMDSHSILCAQQQTEARLEGLDLLELDIPETDNNNKGQEGCHDSLDA